MPTVITLIAAPDSDCLTETAIENVRASLDMAPSPTLRWLAHNEACTFITAPPTAEPATLKAAVQASLGTRPVDIHVTNTTSPKPEAARKKLLVADMESTIIREELIDELANRTGLGNEIAAITARAMRGELDFASALQSRVAQFAGLDAGLLDDLYDTAVTLMPGAETLVKTMRANGAVTALVSGGFTLFTARIAERLGFDCHRGNRLEIIDGKMTGRIQLPILDRASKAAALNELASTHGINADETLAVGDGANDLDMLEAAGLGVAFRGKPVVADAADVAVHHGDLTSLLYLQGISRDAFVT